MSRHKGCQARISGGRCGQPIKYRISYRLFGITRTKSLCINHRQQVRDREDDIRFDCAVYSEVRI